MEITTTILDWDGKRKQFTGEASMVSRLLGGVPEAPVLKNPQTGGTCQFRLTRRQRDRENDIVAWHFVSETSKPTMTLVIFND